MPIRIRFWETPSYRLRLWAVGMLTFTCVAVVLLHFALDPQARQNGQRFWEPLYSNPMREKLPSWLLKQCESFKVAQKSARQPHARRIRDHFNSHLAELAEHDPSQIIDLLGKPDRWESDAEQNSKKIAYDCVDERSGEEFIIEWWNGKIWRAAILATDSAPPLPLQ